jgi:hypothetical protein
MNVRGFPVLVGESRYQGSAPGPPDGLGSWSALGREWSEGPNGRRGLSGW